LFKKDLEIQEQVQYNKIQDFRYVIRHRKLYTLKILYLRKRSHKDPQKIIARFRRGSEELCNRSWREQKTNTYKLCQGEIETLEHLAINYIIGIKNNTTVIQLLDEKGEGVS